MSGFFGAPPSSGPTAPVFIAAPQALDNGNSLVETTPASITPSRVLIFTVGPDDPAAASFNVSGTDAANAPLNENSVFGFAAGGGNAHGTGIMTTNVFKTVTSITLHNTALLNNLTSAMFTPYTT